MKICGIDEAGRGCLAGDLVIAGVVLLNPIDGLKDSKKINPKKREELYIKIIQNSIYHIVNFSPKEIDTIGLSRCISSALEEIISIIDADRYIFDGNSNFKVSKIETLIKADTKIAEVSASSILAKVTHDKEILKLSNLYPQYRFEKNKGYGTKEHVQAIKEYGYCNIHRKSFKLKR